MKKLILLLFIITGFAFNSKSAHITGGDSWVEQTGRNTFKITSKFYRDCNGNGTRLSSVTFSIRIFDNVTNTQVLGPVSMPRINPVADTLVFGDGCFSNAEIGLCVEVGIFSVTVNLPDNPNGYYFTYRTPPNRNGTILNINSFASNIWYAQIPDPALGASINDSPKFVDYPKDAYMCSGNFKDIDFSCTDLNGDSLVYSLVTPIDNMQPTGSRPFVNVGWEPNHNLANILGPGSVCTINPQTGIVTTRSGGLGNYVIAVMCEEYRNGVKIGEVYRDMVVASLNCKFNTLPTFDDFPTLQAFKFDEDRCFDVVAIDNDPNDTFFIELLSNAYAYGAVATLPPANSSGRYDFTFYNTTTGVFDTVNNLNVRKISSTEFEGIGKVGVRFCWDLEDCEVLALDSFWVEVLGYSIGCDDSRDTVKRRVSIPIDKATYSFNVPNVFSPNGDGLNDEFQLKKDAFDRCYDALNVKIYNRWGQLIYESDDAKFSWDGKDDSGTDVVEGTYFVILGGYYGGTEVTQNFPLTLFR